MTDLFGYEKGSVVYYAGGLYEVVRSDEATTEIKSLNKFIPNLTVTCMTKSHMLKMAEPELQGINKLISNKKGRK
ncbi:MAG TPA: hypothetical protein VHO03_16495 [Ignavibacteriales bacterium]|nr:hypothetical protein [Ignavibacteriales bacterium]